MGGVDACCGATSGEREGDRERAGAPSGAQLRVSIECLESTDENDGAQFLASETEKIQNVPTGKKTNKFQIWVCEIGIACNFGRRATGTSVSPDAHLWPTEGHTPAPGNTRESACPYIPPPPLR